MTLAMSEGGGYACAAARATRRRRVGAYLELGKLRLSALALLTTAVGYALAPRGAAGFEWVRLAWTLAGTGLAALGANTLNEWWETQRDARMERTRGRPLPARRLARGQALAFGLICGATGPVLLWVAVNGCAAALALAALVIYVLIYTPLKVRSGLCTLVGAVAGALPPVIGWVAAANGRVGPGAWVLAGILFLWQIPHSVALAWLYREDYVRGGFRVLPAVETGGRLSGCVVVTYTLVLLPLTLAPAVLGLTGWMYGLGAVLLGAAFVALSAGLESVRTRAAARRVFVASVIYLPLLLGLMVLDRSAP